ncbi:PREDICTED: histone-lysine N-methyltransferase SMYD3 [Ceratosolen solmsi marchali]|uniref:Histone-lysine N-methyltransferase SMYD3 n=1 Tax=Ceratosolen solmsi marchali TaxID=326594 RepID=A0AAJ6YXP4_9HYME|nr:PREDICTED: histone-lysine N-methyltransferase SMYD3 [Ceratosolen solmsi marchali]
MQIKRGDIILRSKPFAYVLSSKYKDNRCNCCFKCGKLQKCSGCQYVYYCDRSCQRESWNIHKYECANLKKILPRIVPDAVLLVARVILTLQVGEKKKECYADDLYRGYNDLMSHLTNIEKDYERVEHCITIHNVLDDFMSGERKLNLQEILEIYGKICVNSYNILDAEMQSIGVGIYLAPSVIDHNCKPNAVAAFEGPIIIIRALEDISTRDWSKIHISYIDILNTTIDRRTELQKTYYFLCECERCNEPEMFATAAICSYCKDKCNIEEDTCRVCDKEISHAFKEKFNKVSDFTRHQLESMKNVVDLEINKTCLKEQTDIFHPLNILHIRTMESTLDVAIESGHWQEASLFGIKLLPGYLYYYGEFHPLTGLLYFKIGKIQLYLGQEEAALKMLMEAYKILKVTHGDEHSLINEQLKPLICQACEEPAVRNA